MSEATGAGQAPEAPGPGAELTPAAEQARGAEQGTGAELATDGEQAPADPTVESLLPERSTGRNVALAAAGVLLLVAAWWSPAVLRPTVESVASGSWGVEGTDRGVLATGQVVLHDGPAAMVTAVSDVPGARVVGAWLAEWDATTAPRAATGTAREVAESLAGPDAALPALLGSGDDAALVVLWEVTDCAALVEGVEPEASVRGALGTTTTVALDALLGPAFDLTLLEDAGVCPEGTDPTPY